MILEKIQEETVQDIEQGKGNPTIKTVQRLLRGSGLTIRIGRKDV